MGRKSTGKRLRFEVFKRDHFTCQYCGAQPPDAVLVVDHIHPVSEGGTDDIHNLITACDPCNQGKSNRVLGDRAIRPDADLLYLETQQEVAELRRYQEALLVKRQIQEELVGTLQDVWSDASGLDWVPGETLLRDLMHKYPVEVVEEAVTDVAFKVGSGFVSSIGERWIKYLYAVARNMAADNQEEFR